MVGGGVGGIVREGTIEYCVEENVMLFIVMLLFMFLLWIVLNIIYKGKVISEGFLEEGVKVCKYN